MKTDTSMKKRLILGAVTIALIAGSYHGVRLYQQRQHDKYVASLASDPRKVFQAVHEKKITDDEARQAMEPRVQQWLGRVDGYFKIPEGPQRTKYMDGMIDEMEIRRAEFEKERAKDAANNHPATQPSGGPPTTQPGAGNWRERMAGRMQSMPPQQRAQVAEFVSAMVKRRAERGLPVGPGPGGGFGPPMGGPRPGGARPG